MTIYEVTIILYLYNARRRLVLELERCVKMSKVLDPQRLYVYLIPLVNKVLYKDGINEVLNRQYFETQIWLQSFINILNHGWM